MQNSGAETISFNDLDQYMSSAGVQQFNYETFIAAYESDPRLKTVVTNFDKEGITFKQGEVDDLNAPQGSADDVSAMAKRATDVGAEL